MSKKTKIGSLLASSLLATSMLAGEYKIWDSYMLKQKQLEGSAIYIPKRHKFKRK